MAEVPSKDTQVGVVMPRDSQLRPTVPPESGRMVAGGPLGGKGTLALLALSFAVYALAAQFVTGRASTWLWIGLYAIEWVLFGLLLVRCRMRPAVVLTAALLFRLVLCPTTLWLSDDLYRYLLDGRVFAAGINPFRYAPAAEPIRALQPALVPLVNHPEIPTIYPPVAQLAGLLGAWLHAGVVGWRVGMSLVSLGVVALVARLFGGGERGWKAAAVYGLCPLAVWETGASGHFEALLALLLVLSLVLWKCGRFWGAGIAFGAAALVKLFPLLLVPLFWRRRGFWRFAAACVLVFALGWLPFMVRGVDVTVGLRNYLANWSFNSPVHQLLQVVIPWRGVARGVPFVALVVACTWAAVRRVDLVRAVPLLLFGFLVISPTLQPWYALWLLPFLGPRPHLGLLGFVAALGLSYEVWWEVEQSGQWRIAPLWLVVLWGLVVLSWVWQLSTGRHRVPA